MFIKVKNGGCLQYHHKLKRYYLYLVSSYREDGKIKQKTMLYIGVFFKGNDYWLKQYNSNHLNKALEKAKIFGKDIVQMIETRIRSDFKLQD